MRTSIVTSVVCGLAIAMGASSASAIIINVDFNRGTGGVAGTYNSQGAVSDPGHNLWNGIVGTGAPQTSGPLTASDNTPTLVTVSLGAHTVLDTQAGGIPQSFAPALLNDLVYQNGTSSFSFNNVPAGLYDIYVYSLTGGHGTTNTYNTGFTIGATTKNVIQPNVMPSAFVLGQNYTVFNNISPDGLGTIAGTWTYVSGDGANAVLNGFQLVSVVPEPGTISLLLFGAMGLFGAARYRRVG